MTTIHLIACDTTSQNGNGMHTTELTDFELLYAVEGTLTEWSSPADEEAYREL